MKKTAIIFVLCAANTPSLHTMQLVTYHKRIIKPALQKLRHCGTHNNLDLDIKTKIRTKANRLFGANAALCTANIAAACVIHPYCLIPLVLHGISMTGINSIDLGVFNKSKEPELTRNFAFFAQQRKATIEKLLQDINHRNEQIQWLKNEISHEEKLKNMGAKTELLEEYITALADMEKSKYSSENKLIEYIAPIFKVHKIEDLEECLRCNEKKIAALDRARFFKLPSLPLAFPSKLIRDTSNRFNSYGDIWQVIILFDALWLGAGTFFTACAFPLHVACAIANMEMAYQNQSFFEQKELGDTKEYLKQLTTFIKLQQDRKETKS